MTTAFAEKVFHGEATTEQEWVDYLKHAHQVAPGKNPNPYDRVFGRDGKSSYKVLAEVLRDNAIPVTRVLDLACGDAHLMTYIDRVFDHPIEMVGIDMSKDELGLAKEKSFQNKSELKLEMAQSMSAPDGHFDAAVSHMAFMLMNPIEPVVKELHRVLKPQATFATITDGATPTQGFYPVYREVRRKFMLEKFPNFLAGTTGDPRLSTIEGTQEILGSYFEDIRSREFNVTESFPESQIWSLFKDYYYVSAMPEQERDEFRKRLEAAAEETAIHGRVLIEITFKLTTCRRR